MKKFGTSLNLSKKQKRVLIIFLGISLVLGYILSKKINNSPLIEDISNITISLENNHINFIFLHILVLSILIASSTVIIGIFLFPIYFLFELSSISYSLFTFISIFHFSGFLYGLLYNFIIKLFYLVALYIIYKNILRIVKKIRQKCQDSLVFKKCYQNIILGIISIFIYDLFLYLLGSTILLKLSFIIS